MLWSQDFRKNIALIAIILLYIVADLILTFRGIYYLNLIPMIGVIIFLAFLRIDLLYFIIVFCTPVSIQLINFIPSSSIDFAIPTEPLLFGVMMIMIYKTLAEKRLNKKVLNHPVSYAILFYLFWILFTSVTSSLPLVSFKVLLAKIWFLITYYLIAIQIFRNTSNISRFIWTYTIPMLFVVLFSITRHLEYGLFDKQAAHGVMNPFFRDHTSYGAILAMLFFAFGAVIYKKGTHILARILHIASFCIICLGLVLSYTRAAWISVIFSFGVMAVSLLKIKFRYVFLASVLVIFYFIGQRVEIIHKLEKNEQESSANLAQHVQSISNITTDASNLERINRWDAAWRMFRERPVLGWGPGTYSFQYAPFQLAKNRTIISTNFGNLGNAHSEYIGPLAESGVLGPVSFLVLVIVSLLTGFRIYKKLDDVLLKRLVLACILALITYLVHGTLNNFLDTDKAASLFWGFIAVFVSLDIYYIPKQKAQKSVD